MPALSLNEIARLLTPYITPPAEILPLLSEYLDLLLKWNARTNLTAIRSPEEVVQRHFGESLFAGFRVGVPETLLDLGSGAGFPGIPIALLRKEIQVTLAESQNKKASFLREAVRTLNLSNVEVWPARAEVLPADRGFHTVTLRAVDNMTVALAAAASRAQRQILLLAGAPPELPQGFTIVESLPIPNSAATQLIRAVRS